MAPRAPRAAGASPPTRGAPTAPTAPTASQEDIAHGLFAAGEVFARYRADPQQCAAAHQKRAARQPLCKRELLLCVIWDEAGEVALAALLRHTAREYADHPRLNNFQEKQQC